MKPISFPGSNVIFGANQPEYLPLPALKTDDGEVISCWQCSAEDLEEINRTGKVYLKQSTFNGPLQPVSVCASLDDGIVLLTAENQS